MALFTRTGLDRFNILIWFYDLNIGPRRTFYEPRERSDRAAQTTGRRHEGRKWQMQSFLMCRRLNTEHIPVSTNLRSHCCSPACLYHPCPPPTPVYPRPIIPATKTWPWSRQGKSNRGEIDGPTNSGLELKIDSWAIGLETDESEDTALDFPIYSWLQRYSANTFPSSGFRPLPGDTRVIHGSADWWMRWFELCVGAGRWPFWPRKSDHF